MTRAAQAVPAGSVPTLPSHIAIIMDGNGRWAKENGVSRARGHAQGAEALRAIIEACEIRPFVRRLTLYTFSTENWRRTPEEINDLMNLLRHYVKREAKSLHERKVRMRFIGNRQSLAEDIQADLAYVENLTRDNSRLEIVMALSYGARQEIAQAVKTLVQRALNGELTPENIDEHTIESALDTAGMNDPDLLIRTGGEQRLSNFLLWQSAYTELYFTNTLWPDFNAAALDAAIDDFSQRERRFGQRKEA